MALPLTPNVAKAVEKLFGDENKEEVVRLLTEQCAEHLPSSERADEYDLEDLRFEVLKLSEGNIEKLRNAVRLANEDWRDLACAAGSVRKYKRDLLGNALERNAKSDGVWYGQRWNILGGCVAFTSLLILQLSHASLLRFVCVLASIAAIYLAGLLVIYWLFGGVRDDEVATLFVLGLACFVGCYGGLGYLAARVIQFLF